jgi:hypothetical protein
MKSNWRSADLFLIMLLDFSQRKHFSEKQRRKIFLPCNPRYSSKMKGRRRTVLQPCVSASVCSVKCVAAPITPCQEMTE